MPKQLSALIDEKILRRIDSLAKSERRNRSQMVNILLTEALDAREQDKDQADPKNNTTQGMTKQTTPSKKYSGKRVAIILPVDSYEKIAEIAHNERRSVSNLCLAMVLEKLEELEEPSEET